MVKKASDYNESYNVFSIGFNDGGISIDYTVEPSNASQERCVVRRNDTLHGDFTSLLLKMRVMAARFLEVSLTNSEGEDLKIILKNIKFLQHDKYGLGVRIKVELGGLYNSGDDYFITTPAYYVGGKYVIKTDDENKVILNQLTPEEAELIRAVKREAFAYAYHGKREQPTLEEATDAAEKGGFTDEV